MTNRLRYEYLDKGAKQLIIVFHSRHPAGWTSFFGERQVKFDFFKIVNSLPVDALFFMDAQQGWYQNLFEEIFDIIESLLSKQTYERVYTIGASYGGYAAIVAASRFLNNVTACVAFGAQTDLRESTTRSLQESLGDPNGFTPFADQARVSDKRYLDCKPLVATATNTRFHMIYSEGSWWDRYYVEYIADAENVTCEGHPCSDHNVGAHLLNTGTLVPTIKRALALPSTKAGPTR
jgi:pimeloyl-ACP methyl ester carboxylesterase